MLGETHHRLHDVLDHDDGDAARRQRADDRHDVADFGRVEPGQHFVEQQELRLGRQRPREFEAFSSRDCQGMRRTVEQVAKTDLAADLFREG